jgi:predicted nucleic acid-binding protein
MLKYRQRFIRGSSTRAKARCSPWPCGTIGLVALVRQRGTLKAAAPVYRALRDAGLFLAPALIKAVLAQFDEEP